MKITDLETLVRKLDPYIVSRIAEVGAGIVTGGGGGTGGDVTMSDVNAAIAAHAAHPGGSGVHHAPVTLALQSGLTLVGQQLALADAVAGAGLIISDKILAVGAGDAITVTENQVAVNASALVSGDFGLEVVSNDFRVKLAANPGLVFATGLKLGTPSDLSVDTTSTVTGTGHAHAVIASGNPGTSESLLKTLTGGSLRLGSDLLYIDNASKNVWINGTPDGGTAFRVISANNDDVTLGIRQKAGQTARMLRVQNSAGQELIVLDSVGNLQSGNPGFVSGLLGWQISHVGNAEFNNAWIRGELHASIFVVDEFHSSGGTLMIAPAGKLENTMTLHTTSGTTNNLDIRSTVGGFGATLTVRTTAGGFSGTLLQTRWLMNYIDITDPPAGHATVFRPNDILRCKTLMMGVGINLYDVWMKVNSVSDQTDYWRYYVQWIQGGTEGLLIPAGAGVISYGRPGDGRILLTADQNYAPYMDVFTVGPDPWSGLSGSIVPRTRIGRLDGVGLPGVSGIEQYGMVASTNLSDANAPYFIASNLQLKLYRVDLALHDGTNPTVSMTADGKVRFGTDIQTLAGTGFMFDPASGNLLVGQASGHRIHWNHAAGVMTISGAINITAATGYANITDKPTSLSGINAGEGTKLTGIETGATAGANWSTNVSGRPVELTDGRISAGLNDSGFLVTKVLPGSNVGTPAGAGLYLGADKMGYYSGSAWRTYMDNTGKFFFAGTGSAGIAWDLTDLYGTDGSTVQWYARASTGKLNAGGGNIWLDSLGAGLNVYAAISEVTHPDQHAVRWYDGANKVASVGAQKISSFSDYALVLSTTTPSGSAYDAKTKLIASNFTGSNYTELEVHSTDGVTIVGNLNMDASAKITVGGGKVLSFRTTAF